MNVKQPDQDPSKYLFSIASEFAVQGRVGKSITFTGEDLQLAVVYQKPGAEIPWHSHPQEAMLTLLEGSMELWVGDEHFTVRPGWVVWMPADIPHRGLIGPELTIEVEAFAPVREDYAERTPEFDFRSKQ